MKQLKHTIRRAGEKPRFQYDCRKPPLHDINDIRHMLPHRPPFLLVDRIFHRDATDVAGIKNVTMNEPFFVGHFPEEPVMPGVLIVEAMAQCSGILVLGDVPDPENYSTYFMKIDGVKFKRKVVPGDTLQFEIHLMEPIRRGFTPERIGEIHDACRILFQSGLNYMSGCEEVEKQVPQSKERDELVKFIRESKRGIIKPYESVSKEE